MALTTEKMKVLTTYQVAHEVVSSFLPDKELGINFDHLFQVDYSGKAVPGSELNTISEASVALSFIDPKNGAITYIDCLRTNDGVEEMSVIRTTVARGEFGVVPVIVEVKSSQLPLLLVEPEVTTTVRFSPKDPGRIVQDTDYQDPRYNAMDHLMRQGFVEEGYAGPEGFQRLHDQLNKHLQDSWNTIGGWTNQFKEA